MLHIYFLRRLFYNHPSHGCAKMFHTSKCMHDMNQTEAEYSRHARGPKEQV